MDDDLAIFVDFRWDDSYGWIAKTKQRVDFDFVGKSDDQQRGNWVSRNALNLLTKGLNDAFRRGTTAGKDLGLYGYELRIRRANMLHKRKIIEK